jgi:hypothetical protein
MVFPYVPALRTGLTHYALSGIKFKIISYALSLVFFLEFCGLGLRLMAHGD